MAASRAEITSLMTELYNMQVQEVRPSSPEYYQAQKHKSYKVNLKNRIRGRALIITMTENRRGWQADVRALHSLFKAFKFTVKHLFDENRRDLFRELESFAKAEENSATDYLCVVFMGHGYGDGLHTWFQTASTHLEIWSTCSQHFSRNQHMKNKPKLFIAQMCRDEKAMEDSEQSLDGAAAADVGGSTDAVLKKPPDPIRKSVSMELKDYAIFYATQPGRLAYRTPSGPSAGSRFIQLLSEAVRTEAHNNHIRDIFQGVQLTFSERESERQMPQEICACPRKLNLFPGLHEKDIPTTQVPLNGTQNQTNVSNPGTRNIHATRQHQNPGSTAIPDSSASANTKEDEEDTETTHRAQGSQDFLCQLKMSVATEPKAVKEEVIQQLLTILQDQEERKKLEEHLKMELNTKLKIEDIKDGSIIIDIELENLDCLERMHYLSSTEYLSASIDSLLITDQFLQTCVASDVTLSVVLLEESYQRLILTARELELPVPSLLRRQPDVDSFLEDDVTISCPVQSHKVHWFKDGETVNQQSGVIIFNYEDSSVLTISRCDLEHSGMYRCHSEREGEKDEISTECYLYVYNFGKPGNIVNKIEASSSVTMSWEAAAGDVTGYKVMYCLVTEPKSITEIQVTGCDSCYCKVDNLVSGNSYIFRVASISGKLQSDAVPSDGYFINMPFAHFDVLEDNKNTIIEKLDQPRVLSACSQRHLLRPRDIKIIEEKPTGVEQILALVELIEMSNRETYLKFLRILLDEEQISVAKALDARETLNAPHTDSVSEGDSGHCSVSVGDIDIEMSKSSRSMSSASSTGLGDSLSTSDDAESISSTDELMDTETAGAMEAEVMTELPPYYRYTTFYDAALIHSGRRSDANIATQFWDQIEEHVKLENDETPKIYLKEKNVGSPDVDKHQLAIANSNYKFIFFTKDMKFQRLLKQEEIIEASRLSTIIPVYIGTRIHHHVPFGLRSINGIEIDPQGRFSLDAITRLLNSKLKDRLVNERNFIKERERANFLLKRQMEREEMFSAPGGDSEEQRQTMAKRKSVLEEVEDRLSQLVIREKVSSSKRTSSSQYSPASHLIVFEGGSNREDELQLVPYNGEKHSHHKKNRAFQPVLMSYKMYRDKQDKYKQFLQQFQSQMASVHRLYERERHGTLRIVGRFGKLYYFDMPPSKDMTVQQLQQQEDRNKKFIKGKRYFRSSFIPKRMKHLSAEGYIRRQGYQFLSEEKRITIQLNPCGSKSKHRCDVIQDGAFKFVEFHYPDVKWAIFNVVRMDKSGRDVRVAVESVREKCDVKDPGALIYKKARILKRNEWTTYLEINREYSHEVSFVREKVIRKYQKEEDDMMVEMQLIRSREYSNPNETSGKFRDVKDWREELVIQTELTNIDKVMQSEDPSRYFINLCFEMEDYC